jgi:hypothetical protein
MNQNPVHNDDNRAASEASAATSAIVDATLLIERIITHLWDNIEDGPVLREQIYFAQSSARQIAPRLKEATEHLKFLLSSQKAVAGMREKINSLECQLGEARGENDKWFSWSGLRYPDTTPGDMIAADYEGNVTLDDGTEVWDPIRALLFHQIADLRRRAALPETPPSPPSPNKEEALK